MIPVSGIGAAGGIGNIFDGLTNPASALGAIGSAGATNPTDATTPAQGAVADANAAAAQSVSGGFGQVLGDALSGVQADQNNADNLAIGASTGNLSDVTNYMVASEEASLATNLTVAVRNNAVQAFQSIMSMPI